MNADDGNQISANHGNYEHLRFTIN